MTVEEAIKNIKDDALYNPETAEICIKALEKQIPKRPHRNYRYLSDYWCECGWHLGRAETYSWCPNCGNKIDWSEE